MQNKIIAFIKNELNEDQHDLSVEAEDDLLGTGLVESMGMMRLIQFVEDEFRIKVLPQDMTIDNFATVKAISEYVTKSK